MGRKRNNRRMNRINTDILKEYWGRLIDLFPIISVWLLVNAYLNEIDGFITGLWGGLFILKANGWIDTLFIFIAAISIWKFIQIERNRLYRISYEHVICVLIFLEIYARVRFNWGYDGHTLASFFSLPCLSWADIPCILICIALFRGIRLDVLMQSLQDQASENNDEPITNPQDDRLDFRSKVQNVVDILNTSNIAVNKSYSIGVVGEWGKGKTSFMNLVKYELKKGENNKRWIIVDFNPHRSATAGDIQRDFLNAFSYELGKYYSGFSHLFSRYIRALSLDGSPSYVKLFTNIFSSTRNELREKIRNVIKRNDYNIVVFIDDFDRLNRDEIIEVFKLIDLNASFPNTFFITGYDETYVNRLLEDDSYANKYFNRKIRLTIRKEKIIHAFWHLCKRINFDDKDLNTQKDRDNTNKLKSTFEKAIKDNFSNVRELKKYVNMVNSIPNDTWEQVDIFDMGILMILRYKYFNIYIDLMYKINLTLQKGKNSNESIFAQRSEKVNKHSANANNLINLLFPLTTSTQGNVILSKIQKTDPEHKKIIWDKQFNKYFVLDYKAPSNVTNSKGREEQRENGKK